ncbi:MAG: glutamate synthase subunit beta [Proteobacteria bacterium]|nr:glutamate synthase subunit beta [Pseudomonadota bacterium]
MGKITGFLESERLVPLRRRVDERVHDWREVDATGEPAAMRTQGGRCMDCGVPFCTQGCPLGNPIPDFADLVYRDRWRDAYRKLASTNDFPEFTGRLCPAPCEAACVLAIGGGAAVTIEALERAIIERAFVEGWVVAEPPRTRTGHRVAVVGSGPAGLAAAAQLNRAGHYVTVYEAAPRAGGLLRYGIPDFKLDKAIVDRRLDLLRAEGVDFRCGVAIGGEDGPSWDVLRQDHDAVVLAIGAAAARDLAIPGRELDGVVVAMDFLADQNAVVGGERPTARSDVRGKRVIILGGGDTGSDCVGTANRQGAASVTQLELMPPPPPGRAATNPWPTWPLVFRTSSSQEEGAARAFAVRTTRLDGDAHGKLVALHAERVDTGEPVAYDADVVILALGFTGPVLELELRRDARGNVALDPRYATSLPGVFAAGDAHRGASLIVWAIAEGREAARHVDSYLRRGPSAIPAIGQDTPF